MGCKTAWHDCMPKPKKHWREDDDSKPQREDDSKSHREDHSESKSGCR
jgi:hypothetical protein